MRKKREEEDVNLAYSVTVSIGNWPVVFVVSRCEVFSQKFPKKHTHTQQKQMFISDTKH